MINMINFVLVVIGQVISLLGSVMIRFALNLYVLDITGRADIFALVIAISAIPGIVFSPIGGAIADRFNRRNLMVIFDFSSSIVIFILFLLMNTGQIPVIAIGIILAILAIISSMYQPAVQASVPVLVGEDRLAGANGIVNAVGGLAGILGPILGGILYGIIGLRMLVVISSAAFFLSAAMEIFIHIPFTKRAQSKHIIVTILNDVKDGFIYIVKENPVILKLFFLASILCLTLVPLFMIGTPYTLRVTLKSSNVMYGIGLGILELSTISGALLAGVLAKRLKPSKLYGLIIVIALLLLPMALSISPVFLGFGYWLPFVLYSLFLFAVNFITMILAIFIVTDVQIRTQNEMLGKVMAIIFSGSQIAVPLGQIIYGFMLQITKDAVFVPVLFTSLFTFIIAFAAKRLLKNIA